MDNPQNLDISSNQEKQNPLEQIAKTEKKIIKQKPELTSQREYDFKSQLKIRLVGWWEQHPILYAIPSAIMYISGKLIKKL